MMPLTKSCAEGIRTADIPLRPEVIEFMDVQSLGRFTCCSATVRKDAREAKVLLSNVQRPAEEAFSRRRAMPLLPV